MADQGSSVVTEDSRQGDRANAFGFGVQVRVFCDPVARVLVVASDVREAVDVVVRARACAREGGKGGREAVELAVVGSDVRKALALPVSSEPTGAVRMRLRALVSTLYAQPMQVTCWSQSSPMNSVRMVSLTGRMSDPGTPREESCGYGYAVRGTGYGCMIYLYLRLSGLATFAGSA